MSTDPNSSGTRAGTPPDSHRAITALFREFVVPSYGRFDLVLSHGEGSRVWDVAVGGIWTWARGLPSAVWPRAPSHHEALVEQSRKLVHVSNLYYHELQGRLAEQLVRRLASGKCFFCNSGAEAMKACTNWPANSGMTKTVRSPDHAQSFHGRTLAGIAATGQDKVKKGFEPMMPGFRRCRSTTSRRCARLSARPPEPRSAGGLGPFECNRRRWPPAYREDSENRVGPGRGGLGRAGRRRRGL